MPSREKFSRGGGLVVDKRSRPLLKAVKGWQIQVTGAILSLIALEQRERYLAFDYHHHHHTGG